MVHNVLARNTRNSPTTKLCAEQQRAQYMFSTCNVLLPLTHVKEPCERALEVCMIHGFNWDGNVGHIPCFLERRQLPGTNPLTPPPCLGLSDCESLSTKILLLCVLTSLYVWFFKHPAPPLRHPPWTLSTLDKNPMFIKISMLHFSPPSKAPCAPTSPLPAPLQCTPPGYPIKSWASEHERKGIFARFGLDNIHHGGSTCAICFYIHLCIR